MLSVGSINPFSNIARAFREPRGDRARSWRHPLTEGVRAALHCVGDLASDRRGSGLDRIAGKVRVAMRRGGLRVAKHLADDRQAHPRRRGHRREGMTQVMQPNAVQPGDFADGAPRLFEIHQAGTGNVSDDNVRVTFDTGQAGENGQSGSWKVERLGAGLAVRQSRFATLKIDPCPFQIEDFG